METVTKNNKPVNKKTLKGKIKEEVVEATFTEEEKQDEPELLFEKEETPHQKFRGNIKETIKVDLEQTKEETDSAQVNIMDDNYMASLLSKSSEKSKDKVEGKEDTSEDKKTDTKTDNSKAVIDDSPLLFTRDDMQDFAEVTVDVIDIGLSMALKTYAKDTRTYPYEIAVDKKRRLVRQLVNIFMKHQVKFPLEFMFIVSIVLCYAAPFMLAKKTRASVLAGTFESKGGKPGKA